MALSDAELRFRATFEDDVSPQVDRLLHKLQKAGATPAEINMYLRAQDQATGKIKDVQKQLGLLPKEHVVRVRAATEEARTHLDELKKAFKEPIEVPLKFTDNLEEVGQKLFTLKTRYAIPMAGMIPGSNMLYGVGAGAGILGAFAGMTSMLEKSISVNSELEQQHAQLTQALKDSTGATQEMGRILAMASQGTFGRADLTQADIIARQFNLPAMKGESKYMPQGVVPTAQNLAAVGNTTVAQAAEAIARATQGYYRELIPYGISIRQEDFSAGGRFAGKSPEEALAIATRRFQGAAELQATTFTGMLKRFHNMFEEKIIQPLGVFTFDTFKGQLQSILGGAGSGGIQSTINKEMDKVQQGLAKMWNSVQRGRVYFQTNIQKPLTDITKSVIQIGSIFGRVFAGTGATVLGTFATAIVSILRPITAIVAKVPQIAEFYGLMKALSLLGFKDISDPFTHLVRDLAQLRLPSVLGDLMKMPAAIAKISTFLIAKGFLDAHTAQKAMDDQFPKLHANMDTLNAKVTRMAYLWNESSTHMKELVAEAAKGLPGSDHFKSPQERFNRAAQIATAGAQLRNVSGISDTDAVRLIVEEMKSANDTSVRALHKFTNELAGTAGAAKSLKESFSDVQRVMTQYASVAKPAGLGGLGGAAALTALDRGVHDMRMTPEQMDKFGTPGTMLKSILQSYAKPSVDDLQALGARGFASSYDFKRPTGQQFDHFLSIQGDLQAQAERARRSSLGAQRQAAKLAPDVRIPLVGEPPLADFTALTSRQMQNVRRDRNRPEALGLEVRQALVDAKQRYKDVNDEVQQLTKSLNELTNASATYSQAQAVINLAVAKFQLDHLMPMQQLLQRLSLETQKYTFESLHPLERQMTRLNQVVAENQHAMSNAQYDMSKWSQGLLSGEQGALNQLHALSLYNKQLQLLQLIYHQIGADLGTTIYDQGASVRVSPMSNFSLEMAQQIAQRKEAIKQSQYDLSYGEQHYQLDQAARTRFQREELSFKQRMSHVKEATRVIDNTSAAQHNLENQQFNLNRVMYKVNQHIQDQQDKMTGLQIRVAKMESSGHMQRLARQNAALGVEIANLGVKAGTTQQKLSNYQNVIDSLGQGKQNLVQLLGQTLDFESGGQFDKARKALEGSVRKHQISTQQFTDLGIKIAQAQVAYNKGQVNFVQNSNRHDWFTVIKEAIKAATVGVATGRTERDIVNLGQGIASHIPIIGHALANHTLGALASVGATGYLAISGARGALRVARAGGLRLGARALEAVGLGTGVLRATARVGRPIAGMRRAIGEALRDHAPFEWMQRSGVRGVDRAEASIKRLERFADPSKGDLRKLAYEAHSDPMKEFKGAFHWVQEFKGELFKNLGRAGGAAIGTMLLGPGIGTLIGGIFGGRRAAQWAEERKVAKEALEVLKDTRGHVIKIKAGVETVRGGVSPEAKVHLESARKQASAAADQVKSAKDNLSVAKEASHELSQRKDISALDKAIVQQNLKDATKRVAEAQQNSRSADRVLGAATEQHKAARVQGTAADHQVKTAHAMRKEVEKIGTEAKKIHLRGIGKFVAATTLLGGAAEGLKKIVDKIPGVHTAPRKSTAPDGTVHDTHEPALAGHGPGGIAKEAGRITRALRRVPGLNKFLAGASIGPALLQGNVLDAANTATYFIPGIGEFRMAVDAGTALLPNKNISRGQNLARDRTDAATRAGLRLTGSSALVEKMREAYATPQMKQYLKDHQTSLIQMEAIYASGGKLPKMFTDYFKGTAKLSEDAAKEDLKKLGVYTAATEAIAKTNFQKRTQLTKDGQAAVNTEEDKGFAGILDKTNKYLDKVTNRIKGLDKDLKLTHSGAGNSSPNPTSTANAVQGAFDSHAKGGITIASAHELAKHGGKLMKVSEEGPEMIIPLMPHRRGRAKQLINQAKTIVGYADGGLVSGTGADISKYQKWVSKFKFALPTGQVKLFTGDTKRAWAKPGEIHLDRDGMHNPNELAHELGHQFDYTRMTPKMRGTWLAIMHQKRKWGDQGAASDGYANPPREQFAESYRLLQMGVAKNRKTWNKYMETVGDMGYGFNPTYTQERKIGKLIGQYAAGGVVSGKTGHLRSGLLKALQSMAWATHHNINIMSGYRSRAEQAQLYALYRSGRGNLAAPPGRSHHELGIAADISPGRSVFGGIAKKFGLGFVVPSEGWHIELLNAIGGGWTPGGAGSTGSIRLPKTPQSLMQFGYVGPRVLRQLHRHRKAWQSALGSLLGAGSPGTAGGGLDLSGFTGGGNSTANQELGKRMAAAMGWTGAKWQALQQLWTGESGWSESIANKASGAYGIPQALPGNKMSSEGADWKTNAATQIAWGLKYIKGRYGDPVKALSQWMGRSPHWYASGVRSINSDVQPAYLHRGEKVLNPAQASAHTSSVEGGSAHTRKLLNTIQEISDAIRRSEKHLKNIKDATEKKDEQKHLSDLNAALRAAYRKDNAVTARTTKGIQHLIGRDASDGEETAALARRESAKFTTQIKADKSSDRELIAHIRNLAQSAASLVRTAHTPRQKRLARVAVRETQAASRAGTRLQRFIKTDRGRRAQREVSRSRYVVGAAARGANARLIRGTTGRGLTKRQTALYKRAANTTGRAQQTALTALRRDLNRHLSTSAKHLEALRRDASRHAARAEKAVQRAAAAQGKHINANGKLVGGRVSGVTKATHAVSRDQIDHATKRAAVGHAIARASVGEAKKTVSVSDRADKKREKAEIAADKRERDFQKKALQHLENIAKRDLSVNIHNEAYGATLKTTRVGTRRRAK